VIKIKHDWKLCTERIVFKNVINNINIVSEITSAVRYIKESPTNMVLQFMKYIIFKYLILMKNKKKPMLIFKTICIVQIT